MIFKYLVRRPKAKTTTTPIPTTTEEFEEVTEIVSESAAL